MDIRTFAHTDRRRQKRVGHTQRHRLRFADEVIPNAAFDRLGLLWPIIRQGHDAEGKIALPPLLPPRLDQAGQQRAVVDIKRRVGFALIPNCTPDREGDQRINLAVILNAWMAVIMARGMLQQRCRPRLATRIKILRFGHAPFAGY